jgi:two-component system, LuxR family, sensor kinase FixL
MYFMVFSSIIDNEESKLFLRSILDTAVDGIIMIDEKAYIQYANESTSRLFGYSNQELIGNRINQLMPKGYSERHDDYMKRYHDTGEARIIGIGREVEGLKKDGTIFPFFLSVSVVHIRNTRIYIGMVHDMTFQKETENKIRQMNLNLEKEVEKRTIQLNQTIDRLEYEAEIRKEVESSLRQREDELHQALEKERELNKLKTRFVSMASHEFRTPLSTILSSASLMTSYTKSEQQDRREKHFHKIKSSIEQLTALLNDFLSISKLEEGKVQNDPQWFDFYAYCHNFMEDIQSLLKPNQRLIHEGIEEKMQVFLDKKLLKIVLNNLVSNAIKYSDEGKTINCTVEKKGEWLHINIQDQGIGIPLDEQMYLFDRFFRAHNATNIQGTGLGLNIVRKYVELMGGSISFVSKENEGSIFTVKFPVPEKESTQNS